MQAVVPRAIGDEHCAAPDHVISFPGWVSHTPWFYLCLVYRCQVSMEMEVDGECIAVLGAGYPAVLLQVDY